MKTQQDLLGRRGTLLLLVIISAFPPLTTDLYLPALPQMVETLNTEKSLVNLTLSGYFVAYAVGLLFWGPLSEKYGRKPILLTGLGIYIVASGLCALVFNIESLIAARLVQAFGGSAITVVATAVVKDMYQGRERERIMATVMSLVIVAPMVAPVLGAFLLKVASWRMMFVTLAVFGILSLFLAMCYRETLPQRYHGSLLRSWGRLGAVMSNRRFVSLLAIFSLAPMVLLSFLAAGSYIFVNQFGLDEQQFSYFFAANAAIASAGPMIYMKLSQKVPVQKIIGACFAIMFICGGLMLSIGASSPFVFAAIVAPATLTVIAIRVPATNLMLEQQQRDTGSAVALIQFFAMIFGALGMVLVSSRPEYLLQNLGLIQLAVGALGALGWFMVRRRPFITQTLQQAQAV